MSLILVNIINPKETYRSIHQQYDLPIQFTPEWMDAVCVKGSWDVILEQDEKGDLLGVLVYHLRKYRGFSMILMPPMTAYSGFYFFYPLGTKGHTKVSYQNKLTEKLLSQLPANSLYYQQYHPSFTNWQPLYWKGYKETSRYTYLLDKTLGEAVLTKNLKGNLRRSFRHIIEACDIVTLDFDTFWPELDNSFQSRAKPNPYNKAVLSNLFTAFSGTEQLTVKACRHKQTGEYISGVVLASDRVTTYYIASFYKPSVKPSGSLGYVFWKSIFECNTQICDFEGSMIKEVEFFLRAFGGELTPHHKVHKVHHPLLRWGLRFLKPDFFV